MIKKILIILLCFLCFACEDTSANNNNSQMKSEEYKYTEKDIDGMKYRFYTRYGNPVGIINLTKDKLEVEYLEKQLEKQ